MIDIYRSAVSLLPLRIRSAIKSVLPDVPPSQWNARSAAEMVDLKRAKILVVGANTGEDCKQFMKLGAMEVHGLDVIEDVGAAFPHPRVTYHRQSIEGTNLQSQSFDLVYSFATMEHVPDIAAGYAEMARLVKPGGAIYSVAAPLWFSPYGNHMACFADHPWIHVVLNEQEIVEYARLHAISGLPGIRINDTISYMMSREFFNMRRASEYSEAIDALTGLDVKENALFLEEPKLLEHPLGQRALDLGFTRDELLPSAHRVIARAQ